MGYTMPMRLFYTLCVACMSLGRAYAGEAALQTIVQHDLVFLQQIAVHPPTPQRLFVLEKGGRLSVYAHDQNKAPWLKVRELTTNAVAFSVLPSGKQMVVAQKHGRLAIIDALSGQLLRQSMFLHHAPIIAVSVSADGKTLLSLDEALNFSYWDIASNHVVSYPLFPINHNKIEFAKLSSSLDRLALVASPRESHVLSLHVWNLRTGKPVAIEAGPITDIQALSVAADGNTLVIASDAKKHVVLLDSQTGEPLPHKVKRHFDWSTAVTMSADKQRIIGADQYGNIQQWDTATGKKITSITVSKRGVDVHWPRTLSPDLKHIATTHSRDNNVNLWDLNTGARATTPLSAHGARLFALSFSPDGKTIALSTAGRDHSILLKDSQYGQLAAPALVGHKGWVRAMAFSPDGILLASASYDNTVRLWNAQTGQPVGQPLTGYLSYLDAVTFSADGKLLAASNTRGHIMVWNVAQQKPIAQLSKVKLYWGQSIAFLPDNVLAIGGKDGRLYFWNFANGDQSDGLVKGKDIGHLYPISALHYMQDADTLVSSSQRGVVAFTSLATKQTQLLFPKYHGNLQYLGNGLVANHGTVGTTLMRYGVGSSPQIIGDVVVHKEGLIAIDATGKFFAPAAAFSKVTSFKMGSLTPLSSTEQEALRYPSLPATQFFLPTIGTTNKVKIPAIIPR